jgi:SNF2 family DNA or RNA helicase
MDTVEDIPHQAIIWAKFQKDIDLIEAALLKSGRTCVVYDGRVGQADRETRRELFKKGEAQFFVANPAAAGEGLTLHMAKTVVYYNSTYKLGDRLQSEDRAHRAGMDDRPVQYIDIVARGTIDATIIRALRTKLDLAAQVNGDKIRTWI